MEQKKTLWIIAAVGAFLLVVLGAAGIVYSPAKTPSPTIASVSPVEKHNNNGNSGWTNNNSETSAPVPVPLPAGTTSAQKVNDMIVVSDNTTVYDLNKSSSTETTIDLNTLKSEIGAPQEQHINITVNVPDSDKKVPVVENTPSVEKVEKVPITSTISDSVKQSDKNLAPVEPVKKSSKTVSSEKTESVKPAKKQITQYWVQVASYSNKKGAENARAILDSNKIPSDIFTYKDNKDKLYFRVRVGPYTTKSEAEYWQSRILKIPYFEKNDSYITSTVQ